MKLKIKKLRFMVKDFPLLKVSEWLPYIINLLRYGYHKNHIRHQSISDVREDRFIKHLSHILFEDGYLVDLQPLDREDRLHLNKVLITNSAIGGRSGTEVWIYEMYRWLKSNGLDVMVYAPHINHQNPETLRGLKYTTCRSEAERFRPDIIHVQHAGNQDVLRLVKLIKDVPIFNLLHGIADQIEAPMVDSKRMVVYGGVSRLICRKLSFLTRKKVILLKNFTDNALDFRQIVKPRRAVIVSTKISHGARSRLENLFGEFGISIDAFGHDSKSFIWGYESTKESLRAYDFALCTGKTVIDMLGLGVNVMLSEGGVIGELVTAENYDHLSDMNFALASNAVPAVEAFSGNAQNWVKNQLKKMAEINIDCIQAKRGEENSIDLIGRKLLSVYSSLMASNDTCLEKTRAYLH
jgi:hypothetical protein